MESLASCTVDELIRLLENKPNRFLSEKDIPFELTAEQFCDFAIKDSKVNSIHSRINALSNIKRAIECRIDELIYAACLHVKSESEKWNFPKKIHILGNLGILAPQILKKINRKRNELEHQYIKPSKEDVEDALDVARLFLESTEKHHGGGSFVKEVSRTRNDFSRIYSVEFNRKKQVVTVRDSEGIKELKIGNEDMWFDVAKILIRKVR